MNRSDLGVAVALLAVAGFLYYETTRFEEVSALFAQDVPPEMFPRMLLWVIFALSLALPFEQRLRGEKGKVLDANRRQPVKPIAYASAAFLVASIFSTEWLGIYLTLGLVCLGLPLLWGERRWKILLPYVVVFPSTVAFLFVEILGVHFDPGVFGF